ncbi:hypothetical protein E4U21_002898 [Claviceps maximensis]|nr:hypothetical protein E4U21_002898 [Claviceps maximensis]
MPKRMQRRRYTKTKFGCKTCKIRKVRCDETWPACQNCDKTGRQCDGVSPQAIRNNSNTITFIPPLTVSHFQSTPATRGDVHAIDARSTQALRRSLIHCIVGELSRPLWDSLLRKAAVEKPVFDRALMAFAALCRMYTQAKMDMVAWAPQETDLDEDVRAFICTYNMSQRTLQDEDDCDEFYRSTNVAVLCDLVYICLELIMGELESALSHLELGLEMPRQETLQVDGNLSFIYMRLDRHAAKFLDTTLLVEHAIPLAIPETTFHELDTELTYVINNLLLFLATRADVDSHQHSGIVPLDLLLEAKALDEELRQYHAQILPPDTMASPRYVVYSSSEDAYLRLRFLTGIILSTKSLYAEETVYDTLGDEFLAITDYAAFLLREQGGGLTVRGPKEVSLHAYPEVPYAAAVIQPLYMTACKCRSSPMRRRAIALMDEASRFEEVHSAGILAAVGRRIIQLEEESLGEAYTENPAAVPEWCRIHAAQIRPAGAEAKFAEVVFRSRPNGMDGEWSELLEVVFW